jgi:hypothetical protein
MKRILTVALLLVAMTLGSACTGADTVPPAPNGITLPQGYKDWRVIGSSHRTDKNTLRVVLGNDIAIEAARGGHTQPWPEGSILAKLVWEDKTHERWSSATVPGPFVHAEFMIRDSGKYAGTGGWGFARWLGLERIPYGNDAGFVKECFDCHTTARNTDHVFTRPAVLP